jgi:hypothetical protein
VKEIFRLFKKHQFQIAGLRSFEQYITDEDVAKKRALAEELRRDPARFARVQAEAAAKLETIPVMAKGVGASRHHPRRWIGAGAALAGLAALLLLRLREKT